MIKSLSKVKKIVARPSVKINLKDFTEGVDCIVELKEPTAAAMFPDTDTIQKLKIKYPFYPDTMLYQIILLAKCYVHAPEDGESYNALHEFGDLAKNNKDCFFYLIGEFLAAFPTNNLDERVDEAKND
jgi:hypothetical protein